MYNLIEQFSNAMRESSITPPQVIVPNGQLHRFHIQGDKHRSKNGWYVLFDNNLPCGAFGSWKLGITSKWCTKNHTQMSHCELSEYRKNIENAKRQHDEERATLQRNAAQLAEKIWHRCLPANPRFPYLVKKNISPFYARQFGENIVLPIIGFDDEFNSLQFISENGEKWFLTNGKIVGNYIPIQGQPGPEKQIFVAESFSTAGSIALNYRDACVIAACNAGNLQSVAINIRRHFPVVKIIICADDDRHLPINIGLIKAREAAIAANALFTKPEWPIGAPSSLTDFNDLSNWLCQMGVEND